MSNNKPDGAAYGSIGLSVAAIVLVTTLMPIIMGGSVALAIAFGEEVAGKQSPEDDNGYQWLEAGDCTRLEINGFVWTCLQNGHLRKMVSN